MNIMWDNAASLCFVTNSKAKEQNLKGKKVDLSIIKIGARDEKINTMKYILPLVDAQGQTVHIEAYGIDQITSDIEWQICSQACQRTISCDQWDPSTS